MHRRLAASISLLAILTGCAADYTQPVLAPDHPANPDAPAAPAPVRSKTLSVSDDLPRQPSPAGPQGHRHDIRGTPPAEAGPPMPPPAAPAYSCPMHPEVVSDQPGRCPKCGMNLVRPAKGKP